MVNRADYPEDDDGEVLYRLALDGVDLNNKIDIEFSMFADSATTADKIVKDLETYGYESTVFVDELNNSVSIYASINMLPTHSLIVLEQQRINIIVDRYNTHCDGWVVEVPP